MVSNVGIKHHLSQSTKNKPKFDSVAWISEIFQPIVTTCWNTHESEVFEVLLVQAMALYNWSPVDLWLNELCHVNGYGEVCKKIVMYFGLDNAIYNCTWNFSIRLFKDYLNNFACLLSLNSCLVRSIEPINIHQCSSRSFLLSCC